MTHVGSKTALATWRLLDADALLAAATTYDVLVENCPEGVDGGDGGNGRTCTTTIVPCATILGSKHGRRDLIVDDYSPSASKP